MATMLRSSRVRRLWSALMAAPTFYLISCGVIESDSTGISTASDPAISRTCANKRTLMRLDVVAADVS